MCSRLKSGRSLVTVSHVTYQARNNNTLNAHALKVKALSPDLSIETLFWSCMTLGNSGETAIKVIYWDCPDLQERNEHYQSLLNAVLVNLSKEFFTAHSPWLRRDHKPWL